MSLNIGDNFSYLGAKPLDTRRVFANKAAMDAVNLSTVYEGMVAYAQAEDKYYRLKSGVWVEFSSSSGGVSDWKANTAYAKNDMVVNGGKLYLCITAHTSGASFDTTEQANWQEVGSGGAGIVLWATNVKYAIGDIVYYANSLYRCNTAHTSSTFSSDSSNWDLVFADLKTWAGSTYYSVGTIVVNGSNIYRCTTAHTSGLTFDSTEEANWKKLGEKGITTWATSTKYEVGDISIYANSLYKCNTAHTSVTFDLEIANWDLIYADVKEWQINTYYVVGTVMIYDGELYKCITAHDSGSAFISANFEKIYSDPEEMTNAEVTAMIANFNPSGDGLMQLDNWEANHGYTSKQVVYYGGDMYRCKTAHTSGATFDSTEEAFWDKIVGGGGTSIANWASGTNYAVGDFVIYNNKLYKCIIANADASFTSTKWQGISVETELSAWTTSTNYKVGDYVLYQNNLYRCNTAHTSGTFSSDIAKWNLVGGIKDWQASTDYFVGDFIYYSNNIYRVKTAFTSTSTFSDTNLDMIGGTPLTSTEVTNLINDFTPSGAIYGSMKDMYSTNERAIGIWIDGKTIYQRTFTCTTPSAIDTSTGILDLPSGINVHSVDGYLISTSNDIMPLYCYWGSANYISYYVNTATNKITMKVGSSYYISCPCYITIKYTKV